MGRRGHLWFVVLVCACVAVSVLYARRPAATRRPDSVPLPTQEADSTSAALSSTLSESHATDGPAARYVSPGATQSARNPGAAVESTSNTAGGASAKWYDDTALSVDERREHVRALARRADERSLKALMELGDAGAYLSELAVAELGNVRHPEVLPYLRRKLGDPDPRVIVSAAHGLARVDAAAALPDLAAILAANRQRPDGFQDMVCAAIVDALAETGPAGTVPLLAAELNETVGHTLGFDYGARIVAAFARIGHEDAIPVLRQYHERLKMLLAENPGDATARQYFEERILETQHAISVLEKEAL